MSAIDVASTDRIEPASAASHELWLRTAGQLRQRELIGWVERAVAAGDKVLLCQSVATSAQRWLAEAGIDVGLLASGQLEVVAAQGLYDTTKGRHEALRAAHVECIERAHGEGYRAVSLTSDGRALHTLAPDDDELLLHEHDLDKLTRDYPLQVLCRYDPQQERNGFLTQLVGTHWRHLRSDTWAAVCDENGLSVHGEIDIANADRLATVLHTATLDAVTTVDLSDVSFLSAQAVTALTDVADLLHRRGGCLTLLNPSRHVGRMVQRFDLDRNPAIRVVEKGGAP
ncbi:MAG: STAS domain-containing protein [Actinophytocola sp.]|nr:STAS domain-containing protein [Actinophytocola sp.]